MQGFNQRGPGPGRSHQPARMAFPGFEADSQMTTDFAFDSPFNPSPPSHLHDGVLNNSIFPEWETGASGVISTTPMRCSDRIHWPPRSGGSTPKPSPSCRTRSAWRISRGG